METRKGCWKSETARQRIARQLETDETETKDWMSRKNFAESEKKKNDKRENKHYKLWGWYIMLDVGKTHKGNSFESKKRRSLPKILVTPYRVGLQRGMSLFHPMFPAQTKITPQ